MRWKWQSGASFVCVVCLAGASLPACLAACSVCEMRLFFRPSSSFSSLSLWQAREQSDTLKCWLVATRNFAGCNNARCCKMRGGRTPLALLLLLSHIAMTASHRPGVKSTDYCSLRHRFAAFCALNNVGNWIERAWNSDGNFFHLRTNFGVRHTLSIEGDCETNLARIDSDRLCVFCNAPAW